MCLKYPCAFVSTEAIAEIAAEALAAHMLELPRGSVAAEARRRMYILAELAMKDVTLNRLHRTRIISQA